MSSSCGSSDSDDDFVDAVDEFPPLNIPPSSYSGEGASRDISAGTQQDIGQDTKNDEADAGSLDLDELIKGQTPLSNEKQSPKKQGSLNSPEAPNQEITDTGASTPSSQGAAAGDIVEKQVVSKKDSLTMIAPPKYEAATPTDDLESKSSTSTIQPDIVASSILERPTNLPGIVSSTSTSHTFPSVVQTAVDQRPKRPPPPKPRHPPKRPPPVRKPVANTYDDGTLTPNTTVDNITRDFAEFSLQHSTPSSSNKQTSDQAAATDRYKPSHPCSQEQTRQESRRQTPSPTKHKKASLTSTSSTFDEVPPWSKMTKKTVLRIDSSPGLEILSTVIVRNLDTGQTMPLSAAAEQVSQYLNPLSLQIMSRTKEFNCPTSTGANAGQANEQATATSASTLTQQTANKLLQQQASSTLPSKLNTNNVQDEETISLASDEVTIGGEMVTSGNGGRGRSGKLRKKGKKITSFISDKAKLMKNLSKTQVDRAVQKVRSSKVGGENSGRGGSESLNVSSDDDNYDQGNALKFKAASSNKGPYQFSKLKLVQDINVHVGAVWSMKFSHCGRLLATAGQNNIIWVWVLKDYYSFFNDLRSRYENKERGAVFATPPRSMTENSEHDKDEKNEDKRHHYPHDSEQHDEEEDAPFRSLPFTSYVGHTADVLDLAWSKNYFTLSSSMDKTVRLWHVSQKECLCCFQHIDFVTAIAFHPKDDRYFLSGSLDGKLRLWNIPEKKVALWNEVTPDSSASSDTVCLITSVNFCENGKYAVCGTYDGRCLFFNTEHLKYWTQIHVRSSRRRAQGHKITGIEPLPSEHKVLITSNDSRVRLYDLRDLTLSCKYKGLTNTSSQIKASFSHDCKYIICGSEDKSLYVWPTHLSQDVTKISSLRRDRNEMWESIRSHDAVVTCAIFAPYPHLVSNSSSWKNNESSTPQRRHVIISADFDGVIKVFMTG